MRIAKNAPFDSAIVELLRGDFRAHERVASTWMGRREAEQVLAIVVGAGVFGAAVGSWRAPEQAAWSAIKLPWVLLATAAGNAALNGMLAPLLGVNLRFRDAWSAVLASFALASLILGAFGPLMAFLVWNLPPPAAEDPGSFAARSVMLLTLVGMIAFAGMTANVRLFGLLRRLGGSQQAALRLLFAWLAVNLLLGSQVSWIARPFVGKVGVPVTFFEPHALHGSFLDEVLEAGADLWTRATER